MDSNINPMFAISVEFLLLMQIFLLSLAFFNFSALKTTIISSLTLQYSVISSINFDLILSKYSVSVNKLLSGND